MVLSQLKKGINYPEIDNVNPDDINHQSNLYKVNILDNITIIIAVGSIKYTFVKNNILYMPIYLVTKSKVVSQLGVFEFLNDRLANVLDEEEDVDLNEIDPPLLYSFVEQDIPESANIGPKPAIFPLKDPKNFLKCLLNWFVKAISGSNINA